MTLFLVSSGEYSSYGICAVFDDRALAQAYIGGREGYDIEEYELNPHAERIRAGLKTHRVALDHDGALVRHDEWFGNEIDAGKVEMSYQAGMRKVYRFEAQIIAHTKEQAIKAANEQRAIWIASGRDWPEDEPEPPKREPRFFNIGDVVAFSDGGLSTSVTFILSSKEPA